MKKVIIPQADIDRLEKARLQLYEIFQGSQEVYNLSYGITDIMYQITHGKYPESKTPSNGFSYVNIVSSSKECDGWLNLFFGEYCIALVRDVEFADMLRKDLPEKPKDL